MDVLSFFKNLAGGSDQASGRKAGLRQKKRFAQAVADLEAGRAEEAFSVFAGLAREGMAAAQHQVGQAYLSGRGAPISLYDGAMWTCRAAEQGDVEACFALGVLYAAGLPEGLDLSKMEGVLSEGKGGKRVPDFVQAKRWASRAAREGHVEALAFYGNLLAHHPDPDDPDKDHGEAVLCWQKAAAGGSPRAHLALGQRMVSELLWPSSDGAKTEGQAHQADPDRAREALDHLVFAAERGLGAASSLLGWLYETGSLTEQDMERAVHYYELAAQSGARGAQSRLGALYLLGRGVERDVSKAETWLKKAALAGEAEACGLLGEMHLRGEVVAPSRAEAVKWYEKAASLGHAASAEALGLMYLGAVGSEGDSSGENPEEAVRPDPKKAADYFALAVRLGSRRAPADLGNLMLSGVSPAGDEIEEWRKKLMHDAERGDREAAFNLGVAYAEGTGGPQDDYQARIWFERASDRVVNAVYWYGRLLFEGRGGEKDEAAAMQCFDRAAEYGLSEACVALAQLLVTGQVGVVNHSRAMKLYEKAAHAGNADAMFSLGAMYGGGHDVPEDRTEAEYWFRRAAERGNALGMYMFGMYLARGLAGTQDLRAARLWLERALDRGVAEAAGVLEELDRASPQRVAARVVAEKPFKQLRRES